MFNALMKEIKLTNKLERLRIYKNENGIFQFNPDKELVNNFSKILYPKLNLIFPESKFEEKVSKFLNKKLNTVINENKQVFYEMVGASKDKAHYGNYIKLSDKGIKYNLLTN